MVCHSRTLEAIAKQAIKTSPDGGASGDPGISLADAGG
jgi:hypothetical protein